MLPDVSPETLSTAPIERAETIPSAWYTDAAVMDFERRAVFDQNWQYAGHVAQLAEPGSWLRAPVFGDPVLLVRARDGDIRAFYNVCRHRGGPLTLADRGRGAMLQCQYHGWTYCLDGSLRGVPRMDRSELFDRKDYGLVPIRTAIWQGLVFVDPGGQAGSLDDTLDGIAERIAPLRLDGLGFHARATYDVACNWKTYVDNYLEGYHLPLVHPELCKALDYRAYVTETFARYSLQHSPLRGEGRTAEDAAFYYFVFPNVMLNVLPGRLQVNSVLPMGPESCRVVFDYFYADEVSAEDRVEDIAFSDRVQQEDIEICEHVQHGLGSRAYDRGRFSPECEQGVYHFQQLLKDAYRTALAADPPSSLAPPSLNPDS